MKKLIVGLLLAGAAVSAQAELWQTTNKSGGHIVLTNRDCPDLPNRNLRSGYSYSRDGQTLSFCWAIVDNKVMAVYKNGAQYTYDPTTFVKIK